MSKDYSEEYKQLQVQLDAICKELNQKAIESRDKYPYYPPGDIRSELYGQLFRTMSSFNIAFMFECTDILSKRGFRTRFGGLIGEEERGWLAVGYEQFIRNGLIFALCQVTESALRIIFRSLHPDDIRYRNFERDIFKPIMKHICMDKSEVGYQAARLLFRVRNCVHNNGYYVSPRGSDDELEYRKKKHIFKHGELHDSAYFRTLIQISEDLMRLFDRVFLYEPIEAKDFIPAVPLANTMNGSKIILGEREDKA